MLRTLLESGWELDLCLLLQNLAVRGTDAIPELRFSRMKEINRRELHVLRVPAEEAFPRAEVAIRCIDPRKRILHSFGKDRIKIVKIPTAGIAVHKVEFYVGCIQRRAESNIFPKLHKGSLTKSSISSLESPSVICSNDFVLLLNYATVMDLLEMWTHS